MLQQTGQGAAGPGPSAFGAEGVFVDIDNDNGRMRGLFAKRISRKTEVARVSLPRERFWDIPVPKIDSPTRQPLLPR
ncbi:MAG: hypothetical protein AB2815_00630, partial [Candidatus Sedimenticola endophacoides]